MNDKMKIAIELPNDRITEDILRKGEWEDDSLFARILRNALMHFTRLPSNNADIDTDMARIVDSLRKMANKINELEVTDEFSLEIMDKLRGTADFIEFLGQQTQSNVIDKCRTCEKAWTDDCEQSECWNNNYDKYVQSYCDACENLRKGDNLSTSNSFGEIEDTIEDINFCPKCGRKLPEMKENTDTKLYCDDCLHKDVCKLEDAFSESMTCCKDKLKERISSWRWIGENMFGSRYVCDYCNYETIGSSMKYCPNCYSRMENSY